MIFRRFTSIFEYFPNNSEVFLNGAKDFGKFPYLCKTFSIIIVHIFQVEDGSTPVSNSTRAIKNWY